MNNRLDHYTIIGPDFFQESEEEFGVKITEKRAIFLMTVKIVRPDRSMTSEMKWCCLYKISGIFITTHGLLRMAFDHTIRK